MKAAKKIIGILCLAALCFSLAACSVPERNEDDSRLKVVSSIFPTYDFARQIAGDKIFLSQLLRPGAESHSYEPTAQDMIHLEECDVFLCAGGEGEAWVDQLLASVDNPKMKIVRMVDCVPLYEEELSEGMKAPHEKDEENSHGEFDEHVWASPVNAARISEAVCSAFCEKDPENAGVYRENLAAYKKQLEELDALFREIVSSAESNVLVVGDRFPFRYLVEEYGLDYFAAFPGCSSDTEAAASTVAFLIEKVRKEKIPAVFHIEFSNHKIADAICEETGAKLLELHSCHNLSADDFAAGVTYLDLMKRNADNIREALNRWH